MSDGSHSSHDLAGLFLLSQPGDRCQYIAVRKGEGNSRRGRREDISSKNEKGPRMVNIKMVIVKVLFFISTLFTLPNA